MSERGRKAPDLADRLGALGFSQDEARVYLHLNEQGPARAADVAQAMRVHRPDIYRVLQGLVDRGAVLARAGRPTLFEAVPPEALFREVHASRAAALREAERAQEELVPLLEAARGQAGPSGGRAAFRVHHGRVDCGRAFERLLLGARRELLLASGAPDAAQALLDLAGLGGWLPSGAEVRVLMRAPEARRVLEAGLAARAAELPPEARFAVVDRREALVWLTPGGKPGAAEESALWTDAPGLVGVMAEAFQVAWMASAGPPEQPPRDHGSLRNA